jgi:hypothetical protein
MPLCALSVMLTACAATTPVPVQMACPKPPPAPPELMQPEKADFQAKMLSFLSGKLNVPIGSQQR